MDEVVRFATDQATLAYYDRRAAEYDEWYLSQGLFAERDQPGWDGEVAEITELVASLPPVSTLDVACGSGFLTRHLRGFTVGLDRSPSMVRMARARVPHGAVLVADALSLPVRAGAFDRVMTGHFYGHLPAAERSLFLREARRVARELVVIDSAPGADGPREVIQERTLNDGSRHAVFKRYLAAADLAHEIAGEVVYQGRWFVAARCVGGGR